MLSERGRGKTVGKDPGGVRRVRLDDFRNYAHVVVDLGAGFNVIEGANAQGKTNLLEALYLVSTTKLLRGSRDAEGIRDGAMIAEVEVTLSSTDTDCAMRLERGARKRASLNGLKLPRAADLIGRVPSVCVSLVDMDVVRGEPADRRQFLDLELSQIYPAYLRHLTLYKRALDQRNALLRRHAETPMPDAVFEPWEEQLAEHGRAIRSARFAHVTALSIPAEGFHRTLAPREVLGLRYEDRDEDEGTDEARIRLARSRSEDARRGGTSSGPHRDDVEVLVNGRSARNFGSLGQQRSALLALKLACCRIANEAIGSPPLLLLDDILSDLDADRRRQLSELVIHQAGQAVLTCTEASAVGHEILDRARVFRVVSGVVERT
ncbi:MAG: DNA replication/repair protein RecF [Fimbriimonadaceae bacterium]|nr:DNA replication/repair protein RecF [Fimbriimonadaceae bacterium]